MLTAAVLSVADVLVACGSEAAKSDVEAALRPHWELLEGDPRRVTEVLGVLGRNYRLRAALHLLELLRQRKSSLSVFHYGAALKACDKSEDWKAALVLLSQMAADTVQANCITCSAAVSACSRRGLWQMASGIFDSMRYEGVEPNTITVGAVLNACYQAETWPAACMLLGLAQRGGVELSTAAQNVMISAMERAAEWQNALHMLGVMSRTLSSPDSTSYCAALSACEKGLQWAVALALFRSMGSVKVPPSTVAYSATVSAFEKCGKWDLATFLLSEMKTAEAIPNIITYSAVISACEKGLQWELALDLLDEMLLQSIPPDTIAYSAALSACEKAKQWRPAVALLCRMRRDVIEANVVSYSAAVAAAERSSQWSWAMFFFGKTSELGDSLNGMCLGTAVSSCRKAQEWYRGLALLSRAGDWARGEPPAAGTLSVGAPADSSSQPTQSGRTNSDAFDVILDAPGVIAIFKPWGLTTELIIEKLRSQLSTGRGLMQLLAVSRLDAPTSGVLVVGKGGDQTVAAQFLLAQYASRSVSKEYICLCGGQPLGQPGDRGEMSSSLGLENIQADRLKAFVSADAKEARTKFQVLASYQMHEGFENGVSGPTCTLYCAKPVTGRTHQIRAHFASVGCPLVGDVVYRKVPTSYAPKDEMGKLSRNWRLFLHCRRVALRSLNGEAFEPEAALGEDLLTIMQNFKLLS
eukprot:TRINITY_DN40880_c0_g1_i1.p1 TRINITY_DN40880_c0_g1~~TRINITY_DN40880_c0_g1_i1.p1  ORF type:complete len:696 (+),score=116.04 TRINITY_DN40880_c0_g1_i1:196-2283(+)